MHTIQADDTIYMKKKKKKCVYIIEIRAAKRRRSIFSMPHDSKRKVIENIVQIKQRQSSIHTWIWDEKYTPHI